MKTFGMLAALLLVTAGCGRPTPVTAAKKPAAVTPAASQDQVDAAVALRFFTDGYDQGKLETADQIVAPAQVHHDPAVGDLPVGPAGIKGLWTAVRTGFPDIHYEVTNTIVDHENVLVQWRATGTQQGVLFGIPASNKAIAITGMHRFRMGGHVIQESWANWDALGLFKQIGMTLAPATAK